MVVDVTLRLVIRILSPSDRVIEDLVDFCLETHRRGRPRLMLNMVASIDGAAAAGGETAPLSDEDDRALFAALRAAADVILVGAGTVRAEDYGPVSLPEEVKEARRVRGLADLPRMAVVSRSLDLDPHARLFEGDVRPYLLTGEESPPEKRETLTHLAEIVALGKTRAVPDRMVHHLWEQGHEVILCEGGPTLNGELVSADLVDELNLTISPMIVGGPSFPIVHGASVVPGPFRLERLMQGERMLFARYFRDRP